MERITRKIITLIQNPRLLLGTAELWSDYLSWKGRYPFLRTALPANGKRLLVVSLTNWVCQVKQEALLAKAVQQKGYTPVIATYRKNKWALRYFRLFGYDQFLFLEDFEDKMEASAASGELSQIIGVLKSPEQILSLEWRGVRVGQQILSTIAR